MVIKDPALVALYNNFIQKKGHDADTYLRMSAIVEMLIIKGVCTDKEYANLLIKLMKKEMAAK